MVEQEEMKPWEQHSAVISIPRFDYKATSSLLQSSHSGFLITCPIKREKSATKEAISILEKHNGSLDSEGFNVNSEAKRRKIRSDNADETANECNDLDEETSDALSLVKLTRSGLVLFTFPNSNSNSSSVTDTLSKIIASLESGTLSSPSWCHRIFPIQETCILDEKQVCAVVSKLVKQFITNKQNKLSSPVKFAIGYNRRGIEETEMKDKSKSIMYPLLDRTKCFTVVASAVTQAHPDSVVDLKCPTLCVFIELLPLSAIPDGSLVVAISVLPQQLVTLKPKLSIKALISDTKSRNKK